MKNITLRIEKLAYGGVSIGRHNRKVVLMSGAVIPGESVEAIVRKNKKDYLKASVNKIVEQSSDRIQPACTYFGSCGGCNYQYMPYDLQVRLKEEILKDCLERIAKSDIELSESIVNEDPWHYRIRAQFKVSGGGVGFYKKGTRDVVPVDKCLLIADSINKYIENSIEILNRFKIKELHVTGSGSLVARVLAGRHDISLSGAERLASELVDCGLSGLIVTIDDQNVLHFGQGHLTLNLLDLKYIVSPQSFIQSNWMLNQAVAGFIRRSLQPFAGKKILDLYAGSGNFSLPFAKDADVTAIEENPIAVQDGLRNREINNIKKCRFINSSAEEFDATEKFDVVILDPPRPGLTNKAMKNVITLKPERIVYMSCDPSTFARDLKRLQAVYDIESVRMIDFFPQTFHIEALAFLRLRG
jgi:23S rRNA (uracil1939-C5)-methyltransferase